MTDEHPFDSAQLESICRALAHTSEGLTNSELTQLLAECSVDDVSPGTTKWKRLFNALGTRQNQERRGNVVVGFIHKAMKPARWVEDEHRFAAIRDRLNEALVYAGLCLHDDGTLHRTKRAKTHTEAQERAGRLRTELRRRKVHPDILQFCTAEAINKNYFHAVLEATKSLAHKVRQKSGLTSDGAELADAAFGAGGDDSPRLAFNSRRTKSQRSEHTGLLNLFKGVFGAFRNPTAHEARIRWKMSEQDALDALTVISLLHRRLDGAVDTSA